MIYFIKCGNKVKIGYSKQPNKRLKQLKTGNGEEMKIIYTIDGDREYEQFLHRYFSQFRLNGEWFSLEPVLRFIKNHQLTQQILREENII